MTIISFKEKFERSVTKRYIEDVHTDRRMASKGYRKSKLSQSCRRRSLYVNFTKINYDKWIIAPKGFEVNTNKWLKIAPFKLLKILRPMSASVDVTFRLAII